MSVGMKDGTLLYEAIAADPKGLGETHAALHHVQNGWVYYTHYHDKDGELYEFSWCFCRCGKDSCLSAEDSMSLNDLMQAGSQ